jgi:hypothetical protein
MIETMIAYKLLDPWQHGDRIAATFPLRHFIPKNYMIPRDEFFGFDPNAFVQQLVGETGISHVWEPVRTKLEEDGICFTVSTNTSADPEREARSQVRQLAWEIWNRFSPSLDPIYAHSGKKQAAQLVANLFANFVLDNVDLLTRVENWLRTHDIDGRDVLKELERRAQGGPPSQ